MAGITARRRLVRGDMDQLLHPRHIHDVAQALAPAGPEEHLHPGSPGEIDMTSTPLGLQISASKISQPDGDYYLYGLSRRDGSLTEKTAARLAQAILLLKHPASSVELVNGQQGVFHLIINR